MRSDLVVLADADNTLWDTDSVFADAQLLLLSHVEAAVGARCASDDRLAFVRLYDQALASRHHLHLKYPPQMLATALGAGLLSSSPDDAATHIIVGRQITPVLSSDAINTAVESYLGALSRTPDLLPSVRAGLTLAQEAAITMYVMTEGRAEKQRRVMAAHKLDNVFAGVWELTKNKAQFERLRRRFQNASVVVIGDQPDRDIVPAHQAGCLTILIPSRFRPKWHSEEEWSLADLVAQDFLEGIAWALTQGSTCAKKA